MRVVLVGAGRVGTAVATILQKSGHTVVGVWSRRRASAQAAASQLGVPVADIASLPGFEAALIGVADHAIGPIAAELSERWPDGATAVHFAGSLGTAALAPIIAAGGEGVAMHPVQACPSVEVAVRRLPGSAWGVTGSTVGLAWARHLIASDLEGRAVEVDENLRPSWHAAAALVSGGIPALVASGIGILAELGFDDPEDILRPLAEGTLANLVGGGSPTGPVARGEDQVVAAHLDGLRQHAPDQVRAYVQAVHLVLAATKGLPSDRVDAIRRALEAS